MTEPTSDQSPPDPPRKPRTPRKPPTPGKAPKPPTQRKPRQPRKKPAVAQPMASVSIATPEPVATPEPIARPEGVATLPALDTLLARAAPDLSDAAPADAPPAEPAPDETEDSTPDEPLEAHFATLDELGDWDAQVVASENGHVLQSRAWADYRVAHGWRAWHVAFNDGFRLLVLGPPTSARDSGSAYASRGPIPEAHAELSGQRAALAAELLAEKGADSLTVDGEMPASTGLGDLLRVAGFERTEEHQPSRHRMDVQLGPDDAPNSDEKTIFLSFGATTRNLIRQADRHGLRVKRLDAGGGRAEGEPPAGLLEEFETVDLEDATSIDDMLRTFYGMLDATAERRGFALASEDKFLDWSRRGIAAGHIVYLQAEHPQDGPVAGATFYRHGHRLTYSLAGDRAELRRNYPGAVRLLVWRGIQIALDERRTTVDLGGIDTERARNKPDKGDPTYGMYQFKESFGARWIELTGAHRKTMRPMHSLAGRVLGRLAALRR